MPEDGADDTVRLPPRRDAAPVPRKRSVAPWVAAAVVAALMLGGGIAYVFFAGDEPPPRVAVPLPPPVPSIPWASEAEILRSRAGELAIRHFAGNPAVLVLDFPSLAEQATMLNRLAALVEKVGLPRDRVLNDAELDTAIRAAGGTAETFYYGHNYRVADIVRFFALAERDGVTMNTAEARLRALLGELGWLREGANAAIVSIPHAGVEPWLDTGARAAMLRHELSHGEFFTNPAYAALVWRFWRDMLTEAEREAFRAVLANASYDPALDEVMANEAHAFLFHTPDARFFSPATIGMTAERFAELRAAFVAAMPEGWLREAMR
jgi:hypothetical protein